MASGEQLKALLKSHADGDDDRFFSVAMQVAAHEARRGHGRLAEELRILIDRAKSKPGTVAPVPIGRPRGELANLLGASYPSERLGQMVLGKELGDQIQRVIREQRHAGRIVERGLAPRRKLLLTGPPGTGKTLTAAVLAGELGLPLLQVRLDGLITKYMGETAAKLRQIFEATGRTRGVYFFDEFDAIGSQRGLANDVGEIRPIGHSGLLLTIISKRRRCDLTQMHPTRCCPGTGASVAVLKQDLTHGSRALNRHPALALLQPATAPENGSRGSQHGERLLASVRFRRRSVDPVRRERSGPAGRGAGQPAACRSLAASRVGSRAIAAPFSRSASRSS